nr:retrovirus-related Pol polyprotein from transposon TNT 1-94 [Tanacetum cinerariifolium]
MVTTAALMVRISRILVKVFQRNCFSPTLGPIAIITDDPKITGMVTTAALMVRISRILVKVFQRNCFSPTLGPIAIITDDPKITGKVIVSTTDHINHPIIRIFVLYTYVSKIDEELVYCEIDLQPNLPCMNTDASPEPLARTENRQYKKATQNGVVERRNRTLVEAARTMIIFSRAPLFLWAEAIATACYTQNRSIIHHRFNQTPYELINCKKPNISFLHVFGALCYPKNDWEDIGKLGAKDDIGFFIGYSANSCAYRVYNRRTKKIMETMNVTFDELSAMDFEQSSFIDADHPSHVYKIKKALYGLNQAPRAWYDELSKFLLQNHFIKGTINPTLFIRRFDNDILVVQVYVDDIIFESTNTRPDIVHATCLCARYQAKPTEKLLKEVKRIFCYLWGTVNMGLCYTKDSGFELTGFLDADYARCKDTFKSTSGGTQFLGEKLVGWSSKKLVVPKSFGCGHS